MPQDFKGVLHEWGEGKLHSGSTHGPVVKNQKQAIAIAYSEDRKMKHKDPLRHAMKHVGDHGY